MGWFTRTGIVGISNNVVWKELSPGERNRIRRIVRDEDYEGDLNERLHKAIKYRDNEIQELQKELKMYKSFIGKVTHVNL